MRTNFNVAPNGERDQREGVAEVDVGELPRREKAIR